MSTFTIGPGNGSDITVASGSEFVADTIVTKNFKLKKETKYLYRYTIKVCDLNVYETEPLYDRYFGEIKGTIISSKERVNSTNGPGGQYLLKLVLKHYTDIFKLVDSRVDNLDALNYDISWEYLGEMKDE